MHAQRLNASCSSKPWGRSSGTSSRATTRILHGMLNSSVYLEFSLTFSRSMLSYPLCPFFVVFCNVVGTSNAQDFQLLQDVTDGISELVSENKFVNRLHRLCSTLLELCKPLIQTPTTSGRTNVDLARLGPTYSAPATEDYQDQPMVSGNNDSVDDLMTSSWEDDRMWQLFQSQPSLDWFNADILDPTWSDFGLPK